MLANALPSDAVARSRLLSDVRNLAMHAHSLHAHAPALAQVAMDGVRAWACTAAGQLTADEAWRILAAMGAPVLDEAVGAHSGGTRRLLDRALPALAKAKDIPRAVLEASLDTLHALRALGLPYDTVLDSDGAAYQWMTRGAAFGEQAWRTRNARRHPVLGWWANHGFEIPRDGLCPEGVVLMEEAVRRLAEGKGKLTMELSHAMHNKGRDWRVALAFATLGDPIGVVHARKVPDVWRDFVRMALDKNASAHAQLRSAQFRASLPSLATILSLKTEPHTPDMFLVACGDVVGA